MGAVSAAGYGAAQSCDALFEGRDGLTPLSLFDSELKQVPLTGQIETPPEEILGQHVPDRTTGLALCAVREAMAGIGDTRSLRLGVVLATTVAGMTRSELFYKNLRIFPDTVQSAARELKGHQPDATAGAIASVIGAQGAHAVSTACSTGLHAAGMAKRLIEQGYYDLCLAVGADALSVLTIRGFASLMLIDFNGCKPFDAHRVGISLGEGAGALLLASPDAARQVTKSPAAYLSGWGASADCHHMTAPHPDGAGAKLAVQQALSESAISPEDISFICSHGTATPDNDIAEIAAMKQVFTTLPPFCSMKGTLGHTLAASGTLETVYAAAAMAAGVIPATAGFSTEDEKIGCSPAAQTRTEIQHVLKNSFGFGGNNAAVVISRNPVT